MDLATHTEPHPSQYMAAIHKQRERARRIREQETAIGAVQRLRRMGE